MKPAPRSATLHRRAESRDRRVGRCGGQGCAVPSTIVDEAGPEHVFARAQTAVEAGEWTALFECLDAADLKRIAQNSLTALLGSSGPELRRLCAEHGYGTDRIDELNEIGSRIAESARLVQTDPLSYDPNAHRELVKEHAKCLKDGFGSVADLPGFAASLERAMRSAIGGGSVSSQLFVGESLQDLVVEERRAWATRYQSGVEVDDIGFVQKRGKWFIKLFARRPPG